MITPLVGTGTFAGHTGVVLDAMADVGAEVVRLDMPGDHYTDTEGRFLAIAQQVVPAMNAVDIPDLVTAVGAKDKLTTTWASVKAGI